MKHSESQRGQALVIFALAAIVLFGMAAIAVDQGFAAAQRRDIQAAVDQAALAGTRQYSQSSNNDLNGAHFVALEYLGSVLGFSVTDVLPKNSCKVNSCPADTYGSPSSCPLAANTTGYCFALADTGKILDISATQSRSTFLAGAIGITQITVGTGARAKPPGPITIGVPYNLVTLGGGADDGGGGVKTASSGNVSGSVYVTGTYFGSTGGGGHPVKVANSVTDSSGVPCPGASANYVDFSGVGNQPLADIHNGQGYGFVGPTPPSGSMRPNRPAPPSLDNYSPVPPGTYSDSSSAQDPNSHNWNPGTYNGFLPDTSELLNPGVYKITNMPASPNQTMDLSGLTQAVSLNSGIPAPYTPPGVAEPGTAVAFVFDSTDLRPLTIDTATLNGFEGDSDTYGTHNFVLYGGPLNVGAVTSGYSGSITITSSKSDIKITGIVYMPNTDINSTGSATYDFEGAAYFKSASLAGGGNNVQVFQYICGLNVIVGKASDGGLIK